MTHRIDPDPRYIAGGIARLEHHANTADDPLADELHAQWTRTENARLDALRAVRAVRRAEAEALRAHRANLAAGVAAAAGLVALVALVALVIIGALAAAQLA